MGAYANKSSGTDVFPRGGLRITKDYSGMDKDEARDAFRKDTGILVDPHMKYDISDSNYYMILNTLASLHDTYGDQMGFDMVTVATKSKWEDPEYKNAYATAHDVNFININPKYFMQSYDELNEQYLESTQGTWDNFHPNGTVARDIIAHEVGHIMFNRYLHNMWDKYGGAVVDKSDWGKTAESFADWNKINEWINSTADYPTSEENIKNSKFMSAIWKDFNDVVKDYQNYLTQPEQLKYLGTNPHTNTPADLIRGANPFNRGKLGISEYATKNFHELMAESFADVSANGNKAKVLSKMIVNKFMRKI